MLSRLPDPPHHLFKLEAGQFDAAAAAWRVHVRAEPRTTLDDENFPNNLGYCVLAREPAKGIEVLRLVATCSPSRRTRTTASVRPT